MRRMGEASRELRKMSLGRTGAYAGFSAQAPQAPRHFLEQGPIIDGGFGGDGSSHPTFLSLILIMALASCASPDPTLFTLQPVAGTPAASATAQVIELRRPGLAGYLDRPDIVLRDAGYQLSVNSQQRWAEPIGDMIGRVLTQDLSQRLPSSTVFSESGAITADPNLRIEVDIVRFDQGADGRG